MNTSDSPMSESNTLAEPVAVTESEEDVFAAQAEDEILSNYSEPSEPVAVTAEAKRDAEEWLSLYMMDDVALTAIDLAKLLDAHARHRHQPLAEARAEVTRLRNILLAVINRHKSATQNWQQAALDAQQKGNHELAVSIQNTALTALEGFPIHEAVLAIQETHRHD